KTTPSQTWRTFLDNHLRDLVSIDFFTVPTARLRVLFVFIVLSHERRRVVHFNVTEHPTAEWAAQQMVEAFPDDQAPRYLIRDRDGIYGKYFQHRVQGMGIQQVRTAPRSPWQNAHVSYCTSLAAIVVSCFSLQVRSFAGVLLRQIVGWHFEQAIPFIVVPVSA